MTRKKLYLLTLILIIIRVVYGFIAYIGMRLLVRIIARNYIVHIMQFNQVLYWGLTIAAIIALLMALNKGPKTMTSIVLILLIIQVGFELGIRYVLMYLIGQDISFPAFSFSNGQILSYVSMFTTFVVFIVDIIVIIILSILYSRERHGKNS